MDPQDTLSTFAEVSVALAGFIGITAAFRRRDSSWSPSDISSVRFVLEVSFAALFLSVVPVILVNVNIDESIAWRISGVIMAAALMALFIYQSLRRRRLESEHGEKRSLKIRPLLMMTYIAITLAIAVCSILNVAVTGAYLVGVAMLLASAAIEFLAFVADLDG